MLRPSLDGVAGFALLTELPLMPPLLVGRLMARETVRLKPFVPAFDVALRACHRRVLACEFEVELIVPFPGE